MFKTDSFRKQRDTYRNKTIAYFNFVGSSRFNDESFLKNDVF